MYIFCYYNEIEITKTKNMTNPEKPTSNHEAIKAQIYANYDSLKDTVAPVIEKYHGFGYGNIEDNSYVNKGQNRAVFLVAKNDKEYVVKVPSVVRGHDSEITDDEVEANSRVYGMQGYEHIVAASPENIIISEYIKGSDMSDISPEDLGRITDDQIDQYVRTIIEGHARNLSFDPKPGNVIYDTENGFSIIDFGTNRISSDDYKANPALALSWGIEPFLQAGLGDGDRGEYVDDPVKISELSKIKIPLIEAYIKAIERQLDSEHREVVYLELDEKIALARREAFDMDGLLREREELHKKYDESRRNFDPTKDAGVDSFV
jgi:hypothetical protein